MKTILSGYNIDKEIIDQLVSKSNWKEDNITPETISAAYARISRDPADIDILRKKSRKNIDKTRKSNQTIIFGLGHSSVAEHAYFNFDIIDISRRAAEYVQTSRLVSFTEKSQRYITLDGGYHIPKEIINHNLIKEFHSLIKKQNEFYFNSYKKLLDEYCLEKNISSPKHKNDMECKAKEDARYILSLATLTQFGMSINARSLEYMIKKIKSIPLQELQLLSENIFNITKSLAPSIVKYTTPSDYNININKNIEKFSPKNLDYTNLESSPVKLISKTDNPDAKLVSYLLLKINNMDYNTAYNIAVNMPIEEQKQLIRATFIDRNFYDTVPREFEFINFEFELIVSSTNFAQLKRHRMLSLVSSSYILKLGVEIPPSLKKYHLESEFLDIVNQCELLYYKLEQEYGNTLAEYCLTNAHRKRVFIKVNLRELFHFFSLRLDKHAQWDIRNTAKEMLYEIEKSAPLTATFIRGKDKFKIISE